MLLHIHLTFVHACDDTMYYHHNGKHICMHEQYPRAAEYGIYTLLDMHQDVLSGKFCGEGAPDWAIDTGGEPV